MSSTLRNFAEVFSNWRYTMLGLVVLILTSWLFIGFTNAELIKGNLGATYHFINMILQIVISLLFAVFIPISVYKYVKYSSFSVKENSTSFFGTFIGVLVAGCPACSISIASYIGLAGIISFFPYHGLELKFIAVPMLVYANYSVLKSLNGCRLKENLWWRRH